MEDITQEVEDVEPETTQKQEHYPFTDALEQSGVLDTLAEALVTVYTNPKTSPELFNFFLSTLGTAQPGDVEKILLENQELRKQREDLKKQIAELEARTRK